MTTVVFENATIQDVIKKAVAIAPTRGGAFDKAAGLMMEVDPATTEVTIKATNLEVTYMEVCDAVSIEGDDAVKWLIPSEVLGRFASKLPIGSGKEVKFTQDGGMLDIRTGRTRAKMHLMNNPYYPDWQPFDPSDLSKVGGFGDLVDLVQWAAEKSTTPPLCGIMMDGEVIAATDRFRVARAPLLAPAVYKQITIPASVTRVLSKHMGDVEIGISENHLLIMPDDSTQITTVLFGAEHPKLNPFFHASEPDMVTFKKQALIEIIDRAMVMSGSDRTPALRTWFYNEKIAVLMMDEHHGQVGDVIDVPGHCQHDRHQIIFAPKMVLDALNHAPNDDVEIWYDKSNPLRPVRMEGGSGYQVIIVPRKDLSAVKEDSE